MKGFDLGSLFERAFGERNTYDAAKANQRKLAEVGYYAGGYDNVIEGEGQAFTQVRNSLGVRDMLGRPVFMPTKIHHFILPNEALIWVTAKKNIVETQIVGFVDGAQQQGTVKEYIGLGDYDITIRGVLLHQDIKVYPEDDVTKLHTLFLEKTALKIENALMTLLGINRIVLKELNLPPTAGVQHVQAYELKAVSDFDFSLEILE